jgi:hypothetical protein
MRRHQRGVSILGWLVIIILVGAVAMLIVRLAPHYIDYQTLVSVIEGLPANSVHSMSKTEIRESVLKRMLINNIRDLNVRDILEIDRKRDGTALILNYERREHLVYNIDIVLTFSRRFDYK